MLLSPQENKYEPYRALHLNLTFVHFSQYDQVLVYQQIVLTQLAFLPPLANCLLDNFQNKDSLTYFLHLFLLHQQQHYLHQEPEQLAFVQIPVVIGFLYLLLLFEQFLLNFLSIRLIDLNPVWKMLCQVLQQLMPLPHQVMSVPYVLVDLQNQSLQSHLQPQLELVAVVVVQIILVVRYCYCYC